MARERRSLQDHIRSRQQSGFIGRQGQVTQYQENLRLPVDDERRRFLFSIHGDAGVGKTHLTTQLQQITIDAGGLTAYIDETIDDAIAAMTVIAAQFKQSGAKLGEFEKRVAAYRQRRHELESDPQAPEGVAALLTKTAVMIGLSAASMVPIAGSVLATVDNATIADQANRARIYLARRFNDHADVRLLLAPTDELTPIFVSELNRVAANRPIGLFFDTYERTGPLLDRWLLSMYKGRYGDLPESLITTVSGQTPLDPNIWSAYLSIIADVSLQPFSEVEARQFLASKNIHDEAMIQVILSLSGRLPMWIATLAEVRPQDATEIGDPAGMAVERFLKWEQDPAKRTVALTAALPRSLNQDVLAAITPAAEVPEMFSWLCSMPFVSQRVGAWAYHKVVRAAMLRLQLAQAPIEWRSNQLALVQANRSWAGSTIIDSYIAWTNANWIDYTREEVYHLLCADPVGNLPIALASAVKAAEHSGMRARQWAELIDDAGRDANNPILRQWGARLGKHAEDLTQYFTDLINEANLNTATLTIALEERGNSHLLMGRHGEALADFTRAIELNPAYGLALSSRGETYRLMGRYDEALSDLTRAIELNPGHAWAVGSRGETYRRLGRYDEALADFTRAIELNPRRAWAVAHRGETYRRLGRYDEALADFTRAIELNPRRAWAVAHRGETYRRLGRYDEALADFTRAIELNPAYDWALGRRSQTYRQVQDNRG